MFAEELSGNASKRRQAENRARRRQQKLDQQKKQQQQQQQKEQQQQQQVATKQVEAKQDNGVTSSSNGAVTSPATATATTTTFPTATATITTATSTTGTTRAVRDDNVDPSSGKKKSALEQAAIQRQLRSQKAIEQKSLLRVQAFARWFLTKTKLVREHQALLKQRLQDLGTLRQLLAAKSPNTPYVPPQATSTLLMRQFLFTIKHTPLYNPDQQANYFKFRQGQDLINLHNLLQHVILPGLGSNDANVNPFMLWNQSKEGQFRIRSFLQVCFLGLLYMTTNTPNKTLVSSIITVFQKLLVNNSSSIAKNLLPYLLSGRPIFLSAPIPRQSSTTTTTTTTTTTLSSKVIPPFAYISGNNHSMDMIQMIRFYLLHFTSKDGTTYPIPQQSSQLREDSISSSFGAADALVEFLIQDFLTVYPQVQSRIVQEIFTVPLLTWKVSATALTKLFAKQEQQQQQDGSGVRIVSILNSFMKQNKHALANGQISTILPCIDISNKTVSTFCPATNTQCLLANLIHIGRACPLWNGSSKDSFDYHSSAMYFYIISTLLDVVPIGTFLSRDSAVVEWVDNDGGGSSNTTTHAANNNSSSTNSASSSNKTHYTPVVLSPVILDHCRLLLVDSYVRKIFHHATAATTNTNNNKMKSMVDDILNNKNDKDVKYEQEFINEAKDGGTATSLAAKEARVNRRQGFWNSSKWANKLTKGVSSLFSAGNDNNNSNDLTSSNNKKSLSNQGKSSSNNKLSSSLRLSKKNFSGSSQTKLMPAPTTAVNNNDTKDNTSCDKKDNFSPKLFFALCRAYGIILARWGGNGSQDVILEGGRNYYSSSSSSLDVSSSEATSKADPCTTSLLNVLCFSTDIVRTTWAFIQSDDTLMENIQNVIEEKSQLQHPSNLASSSSTTTTDGICIRSQSLRPLYNNYYNSSNDNGNNNWTSMIMAKSEKKNISPLMMMTTNGVGNNSVSIGINDQNGLVMDNDGIALFFMFVCAFSHTLIITDDVEIHDMGKPIPIHQIRRCIILLKQLLCQACTTATTFIGGDDDNGDRKVSSSMQRKHQQKSNYFGLAMISWSSQTMRELYDRSSRRPICLPKLWLTNSVDESIQLYMNKHCKTHKDYMDLLLKKSPILRICPFLISFKRRLKLFERIITTSRNEVQGVHDNIMAMNMGNAMQSLFNNNNPLKPGIPVQITRGRVLEDGLLTLNKLGKNLRQRLAVQYVNEAGSKETGVDAGGLFKEFWTDLSVIAFNPNYALFRITEGNDNCLYPNPSSKAAHGAADSIQLFEFLGRILGKALYEGITIHPKFAHFFLSFLRGDYNYLHMLPDLSTIDEQLYNNLMFLKTYDGDAEDLCLTFTINNDDFGNTKEIPLIPNGSNIPVTNINKQRYIGLVAKYYVVDRVKEQSEAFTRGLWDVIDRSWLRLFNEPELQVLISGATDGKIDVDDMRANTRYSGGYTGLELTISRFWNVVSSLSSKQQGLLLRFVTSCERPPPLGFSSMNPPFTIQRVGVMRDGNALPTASTCFNTLKLPTYSSEKVLRQRLVYAIESGAGFELT